ncbi:nucleoside-diphosphate sugar epimerase/dehydratase [Pseudorhodoplanes sinuspersici]|uniref:Capsular biosynthesis protein n=1 Tax=Pseudorhodoplanes sinuspersici TaxID=1235591 RepID=A0A1W6ZTG3_9HYPH|nr:capsular biosynthesis protein [Pseudorhodoplanes sinuspersici]RKE72305.1 O-antigen biosynthesis protein WbqV [Pseudorhodoplanes sinuspersici]
MLHLRTMTTRKALIVLHDLLATAAALLVAFYIRFEEQRLSVRVDLLWMMLPGIMIYAGIVYHFFHLDDAKWRFASLPDLWNIFRSATVLAITLLILDYIMVAPNVYGDFFFGKATILIYWVLQMFFLGGPRVAYRYFRYSRARIKATKNESAFILILGRAADAEVLLRAVESGAVKKVWPVGVLSQSPSDRGQSIRGIQVLGNFDDLERAISDLAARGTNVHRVVLTPSAFEPGVPTDTLLMRARRLGLSTSRLPSLDDSVEALRLAPVNVEDLLLRPSVKIDYRRLENFIKGRSIVVTGGGGSIGAEICDRVVTFGASRILVIENSEPALHAVLEALKSKQADAEITGRLADIRDRDRIMRLMSDFKPDIVFHAAALKHVPLLERDWGEGVKTNVFGSVNVADAAAASGATAMVMISTDKAIEPVSVLGATKRFAEMYCQALDGQFARKAGPGMTPMRLIAVRFGNVLASNGSVVPKFKAQIEAGGPVTVTHPDMVRYFMTIREACDLVVTSATHALGPERSDVAVYVLNMGQPVKIVELAERIIRLSGLEPGRDIDVTFTGIRPGERLHEILFAREEPTAEIGVAGVVAARPLSPSLETMRAWLATLEQGLVRDDKTAIYRVLRDAVPDFKGEAA